MGLFSRLTGHRAKQTNETHQALAMVMLNPGATFDADQAIRRLIETSTDLPSIVDVNTKDGATVANIPGGTVGLVRMPMPIPAGDLVGPTAVAWHWPSAADTIAAHDHHLIVYATSSALERLDLRLFHTKLVASILASTDAAGVYVGDAMLVRSSQDYQGDAARASRDNLPIMLWVGFNAVREENTLSAYTSGLSAFGFLELEVHRSTQSLADLFGALADIANYQLSSGRALNDGDTFGATEFDRSRVFHRPSAFIPGTKVALLELQ